VIDMDKCPDCGEYVDWDNPNTHYGGHTCDPKKIGKHQKKKKLGDKWVDPNNTNTCKPEHYCGCGNFIANLEKFCDKCGKILNK